MTRTCTHRVTSPDSRLGQFTFEERASDTHWVTGWMGPGVGMDDVEKRKFLTLPGLELRPLNSSRSQSLYRLSHPRSSFLPLTNQPFPWAPVPIVSVVVPIELPVLSFLYNPPYCLANLTLGGRQLLRHVSFIPNQILTFSVC
jgi:hypothetical protein